MSQPTDPNQTVDTGPPASLFGRGVAILSAVDAPADRLVLLEEIARGGMGAVLRGRDGDFGRDVAVKVLREDHRNRAELAERFLVEARIAGCLQHPGVTPLYAMGRLPDGRPYFSMKLVQGRTLADLLAGRATPEQDQPRFLAIFEQVCQTLAYAHSKGVIHRDMKPLNVMVGAFGETQVMDWGLAKVLTPGADTTKDAGLFAEEVAVETSSDGSATQAGSVLGTPAYMAPEQARGEREEVDRRADVFGLGAVLCEILTSKPPFMGPQILLQARHGDMANAYARLDGCGADADLAALAKRCLAADAADRPADAGEVAAAVTAYRESVERRLRQAEVAHAEAQAKAVEGRKRRRLALALAASVLFTTATLAGLWLWWKWDRVAHQAAAEQAADLALGKADQTANQAQEIDVAADRIGNVEPETPQSAEQAAALWRQASASVKEAERALADAPDAESARERVAVRRQAVEAGLQRAEKVARLLADFDKARTLLGTLRGGQFDVESAARAYLAAMQNFGLVVAGPSAESATTIRRERPAVRLALIAALDQWADRSWDYKDAAQLRRIADGADDDPWRRRYRAAAVSENLGEMKRLAAEAPGRELPAISADLLAEALRAHGAAPEAAALLRQVRRQHPADFWTYWTLADCLHDPAHSDPARLEEAAGCYWAAIALRPDSAAAYNNLGNVLNDQGDSAGAVACLRKAVELDSTYAIAHYNLGNALRTQGDSAGAVASYNKAIEVDPKFAWAYNNLGNVLSNQEDTAGAVACLKKAIEIAPNFLEAHNNLGLALGRQGDFTGAVACYKKAIQLDPTYALAKNNLIDAERMAAMQDKLPALQRGEFTPRTGDELQRMKRLCSTKKLYLAGARMYEKAFSGDPKLADDLQSGNRYNAASCAALAAAVQGKDDPPPDEKQKAELRRQALAWLRADLALWEKQLTSDKLEDRTAATQQLRHWQQDTDLSGLRDGAQLAKLPADEQEACKKLWADVQALLDKADAKK